MPFLPHKRRLPRKLGLFDVFVISTGAMISSGFFLLPGLAAAKAGPAVVLAYLLAGILVLPAMFSKAELATAMPRAGGTYYFLDRSLGPMVGTMAGFGTWLALVLKSAFALIGMGAYLVLFVELPIQWVAVGLTLVFTVFNVVGVRQTSGLQRILVVILVGVLAFFIVQGLVEIFGGTGLLSTTRENFSPFFAFGIAGLISTIGFVFVSYAGLTKIASVAEEVADPDRNIPLGMALSLLAATVIYVVGVFIMVAVLEPRQLHADLTPVATAAQAFFDWLPGTTGLILITIAAIAAFASTGNAGILSASRYPLAMARDHLVWERFARLGRFQTPTPAILATAGLMVVILVTLDVERVAKLASSFQLLLFSLLNLAVIVMRESRIEGYDPGFRSPLYPWMQIAGFLIPIWLIVELGWFPFLFTVGVVVFSVVWYYAYGLERLPREGAIYHVFERLGRQRYEGLDRELRHILEEKEFRKVDPFEETVARALVLDYPGGQRLGKLVEDVARRVGQELRFSDAELADGFRDSARAGAMPVAHGAAFLHLRLRGIQFPRMCLVRCQEGADLQLDGEPPPGHEPDEPVRALFFLLSPEKETGQHLRVLGQLAARVDEEDFMEHWLRARNAQELKEVLLRHEHSLALHVRSDGPSSQLIGNALREIALPPGTLIALIRRDARSIIPSGETVLKTGDRITFIGDPDGIEEIYHRYIASS